MNPHYEIAPWGTHAIIYVKSVHHPIIPILCMKGGLHGDIEVLVSESYYRERGTLRLRERELSL